MPQFRKPRKAWSKLSPAYRERMRRNGLSSRNWGTKQGAELRKTARGHAKTPERPQRAQQHPERYPEYVAKRVDIDRKVFAYKERLFSTRHKWRSKAARRAVDDYIKARAGDVPRMRQFLTMDAAAVDRLIDSIDWRQENERRDLWSFLFYH